MNYRSPHTFHIPVMGLAYTIDTPVKVARYGISSVMSIIEDRLVEMMRKHYYTTHELEYRPITIQEPDYRAKRITDYLNLVNTLVRAQVEELRSSPFESGSEITKYFEMLPDDNPLRQLFRRMMDTTVSPERAQMEEYLRSQVKAGSIDVNIMTKTDRDNYDKNKKIIEDGSDAVSALRGYAKSTLTNSSVVFSAGMNPRLFNYLENCREFDADETGQFDKKITIKVSDYRSALIQGKYLAKKGIWVSEFRIESGLNCGGHAFPTEGYLMGPILEEFKSKKQDLIDNLFEICNAALLRKGKKEFSHPPEIIFTAQGGIGSCDEDRLLREYYAIESTGWGTPFLLVPEATTVDDATLKLLCRANTNDVILSQNSPLGIALHYLKGTSAEKEKFSRIKNGRPGSPCTEKHLGFNTEFTTEPICTASHRYQKLKIAQLQTLQLPEAEYTKQLGVVIDKECLCVGLSNPAALKYNQPFIRKLNAVTICPGPNIVNFSTIVSLQTMTDHIYGRKDILYNKERSHMFITELQLYIDLLKKQTEEDIISGAFQKKKKYYASYYQNLRDGIAYYRELPWEKGAFHEALDHLSLELDLLNYRFAIKEQVASDA